MVERMRPTTARGPDPRVTVVIPCYNYGRFLPEVVASVLSQEDVITDVIIVDDASPDGSVAVARRLASGSPSVQVLEHTSNQGHITTYNDGLALATGTYVLLLSADDLLPPGALRRATDVMESREDVGMVYGFSRSFTESPPEEVATRVRSWSIWPGIEWLSLAARRGRCFIHSPEVVMRRAALEEEGAYDPRLPHSADMDLWMRTARHWSIGRVNGATQALYRVHDDNMHLTQFAGMLTDLQERRRTFGLLYDEHCRDNPRVQALREDTRRALAREAVRLALRGSDRLDNETLLSYTEFALGTWPGISRTLLWRALHQGPLAGRRLPVAGVREYAWRVDGHMRWLRWQRYGT